MEIKEFKIRCSAIGKIMTNPRSKTETLSETCKSYLEEWLKQQIYGTRKEINSKYLTKGLEVEAAAADYYTTERGLGFILQNMDHFENDYFTGTPDLLLPDEVIEMKASWDCFTFPLFDNEPDKGYWMQANGYMHLTGKRKAKLVFTLQNTPEELEYNEPVSYDHLPSNLRIKEFEFNYDEEFINEVIERVKLCRDYIQSLIIQIKSKP